MLGILKSLAGVADIDMDGLVRRAGTAAVLVAAGALLGVAALGCAVAALWIYAAAALGQGGAALAATGALGILSLSAFLSAPKLSARRSAVATADAARTTRDAAPDRPIGANHSAILLTALVAGLVAGGGRSR